MTFRPRYVTLDCYCTLTNFDMTGAAHLGIGDTEIGALAGPWKLRIPGMLRR